MVGRALRERRDAGRARDARGAALPDERVRRGNVRPRRAQPLGSFHWSLDVIFGDDACPVVEYNTAENLAIVRRIAYNRIKMLSGRESLSFGLRSCCYDDGFRKRILFSC